MLLRQDLEDDGAERPDIDGGTVLRLRLTFPAAEERNLRSDEGSSRHSRGHHLLAVYRASLRVDGCLATHFFPRAAAGEPPCSAEVRKLYAQKASDVFAGWSPASLERLAETHKDVPRLHVAVNEAPVVHVLKGAQQLHGDAVARPVREAFF